MADEAANIVDQKKLKPQTYNQSTGQSTSTTNQQSQTGAVLDAELLNTILAGLTGGMTEAEIEAFAESLLRPQLNAELEGAQQTYETTRLAKEQEIANLATELQRSIDEQNRAYRQSMADIDNAALARGMGRSSYTLQTLANQGGALAEAVRRLTQESATQSGQLQEQITQAARQNAQTQARLNADYADREKWLKMAVTNTAMSGVFSSDRTINEYNERIWHLDRLKRKG